MASAASAIEAYPRATVMLHGRSATRDTHASVTIPRVPSVPAMNLAMSRWFSGSRCSME